MRTTILLLLMASTANADTLLSTVSGTFYLDHTEPPPFTPMWSALDTQRITLSAITGQAGEIDFAANDTLREINSHLTYGGSRRWDFAHGPIHFSAFYLFAPFSTTSGFHEYTVSPSLVTADGYSLLGSGMHVTRFTLAVDQATTEGGRPRIDFTSRIFGAPGELPEPSTLCILIAMAWCSHLALGGRWTH